MYACHVLRQSQANAAKQNKRQIKIKVALTRRVGILLGIAQEESTGNNAGNQAHVALFFVSCLRKTELNSIRVEGTNLTVSTLSPSQVMSLWASGG
ncbi:hypothetical protein KQX54_004505 [Cotesia glomerata]|uniref:Uncharacterized protein n=1 Tax=Cotesia glomerata TaxID=32391 RepID=A0AAV7I184_COTGL|nr:hypothetical protein KQX54_004505 [Cotesia glomerata]